jgi:hypothetical protein
VSDLFRVLPAQRRGDRQRGRRRRRRHFSIFGFGDIFSSFGYNSADNDEGRQLLAASSRTRHHVGNLKWEAARPRRRSLLLSLTRRGPAAFEQHLDFITSSRAADAKTDARAMFILSSVPDFDCVSKSRWHLPGSMLRERR